jgi:GNAT superfamily N-acetyltransferase
MAGIIDYIAYTKGKPKIGSPANVFVLDEYRRKGIGTVLVRYAIRDLSVRNANL